MNLVKPVTLLLTFLLMTFAGLSLADGQLKGRYEITVTNLTRGQSFTPILVASHRSATRLFTLGAPASEPLAILAEGGDTAPLAEWLEQAGGQDVHTLPGLLTPGMSVSTTVVASPRHSHLSLAAMLIPTNDTFFSLNSVVLPRHGSITLYALAYDAGTEFNDQSCANIPGPRCGGEGYSPVPGAGDEGFVYVSNGFHDLGTVDANGAEVLGPAVYDWRNPVASITIRRIQ